MPLPRTIELVVAVLENDPANIYFTNFVSSLDTNTGKRRFWESYESKFAVLNDQDWQSLKAKAVPRFSGWDSRRGWQTAIDILNEAVAYSYLVSMGCIEASFVAETNVPTPDIRCKFMDSEILCEVKTFSRSDRAIDTDDSVQTIDDRLSTEFFDGKLRKTIDQNLTKFRYRPNAARWYFFVLNFDDRLHEYSDRYLDQIDRWLQSQVLPVDGLIFLDNSFLWRPEPLVLVWPKDLWVQEKAGNEP